MTDAKTNSYKVLRALDHDKKRYAAGKTVPLTDEQAEPLLAIGAVEATKSAAKAPAK